MSPIRRILVAIKDPWRQPLPEVRKAAQLALALGATVQLFHALSDPLYVDAAEANGMSLANFERSEQARVAKRLETLTKRLEKTGIRAESLVQWDFPAHEAVIRAARRFNADLIVAARHATAHHFAWLLRFTDFELLRLAPIPVLLIKSPQAYAEPVVLAAVDPSHANSKPLKLDQEILGYASAITQALHGSLHAVFAYEPIPAVTMGSALKLGHRIHAIAAASEARARKMLARTLNGVSIPESQRHLVPQHPADAIEGVAAKTDCGIAVLGAISRSGLKRVVLGNTAEQVFDRLPCDVLVIKPKHFATRVPRAQRGARVMTLPIDQPGF